MISTNATDWVVFELTPQGEEEDPTALSKVLSKYFRGHDFFIPAAVTTLAGNRVVTKLIDNYVFVRGGLPDSAYKKPEGTRYLQAALMKPGRKGYACVESKAIDKMRGQLDTTINQDIEVGDIVKILSGPYRNMVAQVIEEIVEQDKVQVQVTLRSKSAILSFPRSFLQFVHRDSEEKNENSSLTSYFNRISKMREWSDLVSTFLRTLPESNQLQETSEMFYEAFQFAERIQQCERILNTPSFPDVLGTYQKILKVMAELFNRNPAYFFTKQVSTLKPAPILSKREQLENFKHWYKRTHILSSTIEEIERSLTVR